jgi:hypothetical protein
LTTLEQDKAVIRDLFKGLSYRERLTLWRELKPTNWGAISAEVVMFAITMAVLVFLAGPDLLTLFKSTLSAWRAAL